MSAYTCVNCGAGYSQYTGFCLSCFQDKTIVLKPQMPQTKMRSEMQLLTAKELVKREWSVEESKTYPSVRVSQGSLIAVYGVPGGGKSTFVTKYADGFSGPVVYYSAEEKLGPAIATRMSRLGIHRSDFYIVGQAAVDDIIELCREVKAIALVVDSVSATTIQPEDLRRLLEATGCAIVLYVLQSTKAKQAAGSNAFLHESDVTVKIESLQWKLEKSRYQDLIAGAV